MTEFPVFMNKVCSLSVIEHIRGAYDKFPDFFRMGIYNCRRFLTIQYLISIHLMR